MTWPKVTSILHVWQNVYTNGYTTETWKPWPQHSEISWCTPKWVAWRNVSKCSITGGPLSDWFRGKIGFSFEVTVIKRASDWLNNVPPGWLSSTTVTSACEKGGDGSLALMGRLLGKLLRRELRRESFVLPGNVWKEGKSVVWIAASEWHIGKYHQRCGPFFFF